jgi:sulfur-carrier protein
MEISVRLPGALRQHAGNASTVEVKLPDPATLGDLLDALAADHPRLERRLRDERGRLRRYVNVFVDGEECRRLAGADTPLHAAADIQIIPSVAGG